MKLIITAILLMLCAMFMAIFSPTNNAVLLLEGMAIVCYIAKQSVDYYFEKLKEIK